MTPRVMKKKNLTLCLLFYFLHKPSPNTSCNKNKAQVCSTTNPTALSGKLKISLTTLPTIAGNSSTAFPASLLRASNSLFSHFLRFFYLLVKKILSHFFKIPSSFGGEDPEAAGPLPETPIIASIIVEIVIESTASIDISVIPCSLNDV